MLILAGTIICVIGLSMIARGIYDKKEEPKPEPEPEPEPE